MRILYIQKKNKKNTRGIVGVTQWKREGRKEL